MPIGQRTPGPINLFARFRNNSTGFYLGTCVTAPEPEFEKFKIPVMNDLSGRSVPFQLVQDGELAYVLCTLNRFNYALLQSIRSLESGTAAGNLAGNAAVGSETGLARGTLVIGLSDWELIAVNSYAGTTSAGVFVGGIAAADVIAGRRFYSCNLRKYKESTEGTRVLEVALALECQNVFQAGNTIPSRGFNLFTENLNELGPLEGIS